MNDLAIDNEDLRALNHKKVLDMVEHITDNMKQSAKAAKTTNYYMIGAMICFGFLIISGIVIVAIKSGGVSNFFDNYFVTDNINMRIVCSWEGECMEFRSAQEAKAFLDVFKEGSCFILNKDDYR